MNKLRLIVALLLCLMVIMAGVPGSAYAQDPDLDDIDTPLNSRTGLLLGIAIGIAVTLLARRRSSGRTR